jgi:ATP-dependent helicase/nuclease subunit B
LDVDGTPLRLSGKIDRIERHDESGAMALLDYKLCTNGEKTPDREHRRKGRWCDLQLPLYHRLAAPLLGGASVALGYLRLADDPNTPVLAEAPWSAEDLASAEETARDVIRKIRAGAFAEIGDEPPADGTFAYLTGQGLLALGRDGESDEAASSADNGGPASGGGPAA